MKAKTHTVPSVSRSAPYSSVELVPTPLLTVDDLNDGPDDPASRAGREQLAGRAGAAKAGRPRVRTPWSAGEDTLLTSIVESYGAHSWGKVAAALKTRTPAQCADRWRNQLAPDVRKGSWTSEEDKVLMSSEPDRKGGRWSCLAALLPGRSRHAVKNRFYSLARSLGQADAAGAADGARSAAHTAPRMTSVALGAPHAHAPPSVASGAARAPPAPDGGGGGRNMCASSRASAHGAGDEMVRAGKVMVQLGLCAQSAAGLSPLASPMLRARRTADLAPCGAQEPRLAEALYGRARRISPSSFASGLAHAPHPPATGMHQPSYYHGAPFSLPPAPQGYCYYWAPAYGEAEPRRLAPQPQWAGLGAHAAQQAMQAVRPMPMMWAPPAARAFGQ